MRPLVLGLQGSSLCGTKEQGRSKAAAVKAAEEGSEARCSSVAAAALSMLAPRWAGGNGSG